MFVATDEVEWTDDDRGMLNSIVDFASWKTGYWERERVRERELYWKSEEYKELKEKLSSFNSISSFISEAKQGRSSSNDLSNISIVLFYTLTITNSNTSYDI